MATFLQDLKYGARMMMKAPVVTGVAVLSLALGIAANAAMFALLNAFLLEPLPYADQDGLVMVRTVPQGQGLEMANGVPAPNFRDYLEGSAALANGMFYTTERANLTGLEVPEQLAVVVATPSIFDVLGVPPSLGRGFRADEGAEGAGRVLVLHHSYWQRRFLGDPDVLGRSVLLDGIPHTVIGVMPDGFDLVPANVQAIRPSDFATAMEDRASPNYIAMARLRPGASADDVQAQIDPIQAGLAGQFPDEQRGIEVIVQPAREFFPGPTDTQLLKILTVVTLFGLMIACANIANLLLSRAEERQAEVAVRTALGAGRGRLITQLLTESVLMGAMGGVIGVTLSIWVVRWLKTAMPAEIPAAMIPELDPEVVVATVGLSLLAGILFGLAPAFQSVTGGLRETLVGGGRGGTASRSRKRVRNLFVVGEVALALALLSGSGVLIQAFDRLANGEPGFETEGLLTFRLTVLERYESDEEVALYEEQILQVLEAQRGVEGVAVMSSLPRGRNNGRTRYAVEGRDPLDLLDQPTAGLQSVNEAYFGTMGVELRQGRLIGDADRADASMTAVVSESLAAREFPDGSALGARLEVRDEPRTIVGVVEDIVQDRMALAGRNSEQIYLPIAQAPLRNPSYAVRAGGDPTALAGDIRQAVWSVDADQPIASVQSLEAYIDESLAGPRAISLFLMVMGGIALALAAMGIYGVMAHSVLQRQREIGIRMALGAGRGSVVGMVARSGLGLVAVGLLAGVPLAFLVFRGAMTGLDLFDAQVGFGTPIALAGALIAVAVLATVLPARRASGIAPVAALKE